MADVPIEILVLTYNRSGLLARALESITTQTRSACRIRVLDNGSTDGTPDIVRGFASAGVELVRHEQNDPRGCWSTLQAMVEAPWAMLFHDDDLLHPECIERISRTLSCGPQPSLVVTLMQAFQGQQPKFPTLGMCKPERMVARELARRLYRGLAVPFCTAVYRRDALQSRVADLATYGKIFDRPLMLDVATVSGAVLIPEPLVLYRQHVNQDSSHRASGPFPAQVISLQRRYRELLGESVLQSSGRAFLRRNRRNLVQEHSSMQGVPAWDIPRNRFLIDALRGGGASRRSLWMGLVYMWLTDGPRAIERWIRSIAPRR